MTSYVSIPNGDIDQDSPITQPLMTALRDNPIAIAEQDASVPVGLHLGFYPLGTINTTSGTTQTLSGLDLSQYKMLYVSVIGVNVASAAGQLQIGGATVELFSGVAVSGALFFDLTGSSIAQGRTVGASDSGGAHTVTTASTSISAVSTSPNFTAGSVKIYGVR
jgi:hypothetical protein